MFDISFLEILVILVIALIVIGPERMPEVARKAGQAMGKLRSFIDSVKNEGQLKETIKELQDSLNLQEEQKRFEDLQKDLYQGFEDVREEINFDELERPFNNTSESNKADKPSFVKEDEAVDTAEQAENTQEANNPPTSVEAETDLAQETADNLVIPTPEKEEVKS